MYQGPALALPDRATRVPERLRKEKQVHFRIWNNLPSTSTSAGSSPVISTCAPYLQQLIGRQLTRDTLRLSSIQHVSGHEPLPSASGIRNEAGLITYEYTSLPSAVRNTLGSATHCSIPVMISRRDSWPVTERSDVLLMRATDPYAACPRHALSSRPRYSINVSLQSTKQRRLAASLPKLPIGDAHSPQSPPTRLPRGRLPRIPHLPPQPNKIAACLYIHIRTYSYTYDVHGRRIMVWAAGGRNDSFHLSTQRSSGFPLPWRFHRSLAVESTSPLTRRQATVAAVLVFSAQFPRQASRWRQVGIGRFTRAFISFIRFF
ncbi:hypothetical protein CDD80_2219 [Ophiocordyceps camponoti-rufipedis]|uniref:Uncharacterized protein n=1 Tax=Ophiocordyceps camponoti-rufipedis TaxID=2004952 RepID=A0A2C5Z6L1_9HYPO|nr:hypothetical protein CDD80_2219 [Ophiocordyceps camponoti-rufipedis]